MLSNVEPKALSEIVPASMVGDDLGTLRRGELATLTAE